MREIAEATGTADSMKLAILAALNLADTRLRDENSEETVPRDLEDRIRRLVVTLDEALAGASETTTERTVKGRDGAETLRGA